MSGWRNRFGRAALPRFARDVGASVLATSIASVAFTHLAHEPAPPSRQAGKTLARLEGQVRPSDMSAWTEEDVPVRHTRIYDTVAMFSLPLTQAVAWNEPQAVANAGAPVEETTDLAPTRPGRARSLRLAAAETGLPGRPGVVQAAIVPPSRPVAASSTGHPGAEPEELRSRKFQVLGWEVPGGDLIASGQATLQRVASLGGTVVSLGAAMAETVGVK